MPVPISISANDYAYPQFLIDERTGRIAVNFISVNTGQIVRHIPAAELDLIIAHYQASCRNERNQSRDARTDVA
ncbi:MAG TPA: hypothetical protein PKE64_16500 [Anaerolineae bacterium]|nr:hypothetical protein [Anaerolineae bacterium]HMR65610.1 hypothetical protein [Anaerolineae bacterium]